MLKECERMADEIVIKVEKVSKKFSRSLKHVMLYGMEDIARNIIGLSSNSEKLRDGEFWAVDGVSFEVKKGKTLGIIGSNGSGKSTLLKLLNGIFMPDKGRIEIEGRAGALIEVGAGFHPMLTGRENIYINGAILGMSKREIDRKFHEIVDFADIGDFIDSPVKHYSSGMYVRLGFAVVVHCEPDILLIDEVLAVGDVGFQDKCIEKIMKLRKDGTAIVLVSHNSETVQKLCDNVVVLYEGHVVGIGNPRDMVNLYYQKIDENETQKTKNFHRTQNTFDKGLEIIEVNCYSNNNEKHFVFRTNETFYLDIKVRVHRRVENPVFYSRIFLVNGVQVHGTSPSRSGKEFVLLPGDITLRVVYENVPLLGGSYYVSVGAQQSWFSPATYDHIEKACQFKIISQIEEGAGMVRIPHSWSVHNQ